MNILQSKHTKLKTEVAEKLLAELNISKAQLPKIFLDDAALPENCGVGDVIKIERKEEGNVTVYYRVVV